MIRDGELVDYASLDEVNVGRDADLSLLGSITHKLYILHVQHPLQDITTKQRRRLLRDMDVLLV